MLELRRYIAQQSRRIADNVVDAVYRAKLQAAQLKRRLAGAMMSHQHQDTLQSVTDGLQRSILSYNSKAQRVRDLLSRRAEIAGRQRMTFALLDGQPSAQEQP